jgi:hypothetical protein
MNPPDPARDRDDELAWRAFRYIAGEMPAAEAASFEERLAHDVPACAAVSAAVELVVGVVHAAPAPLPRPTSTRRAARTWVKLLASSAAASAALAVGLRLDSTPAERGDRDDSPASVPLAWSGLRQPAPAADLFGWFEDDVPAMAESDVDTAAPSSWMVELAGLDEDPPEDPEETPEE